MWPVALARDEAAGAQRPEEVAAYLRAPFDRTYRLILAPLLPRGFYVNVSRPGVETRVRNGTMGRGGLTFEYDDFVSTVAHELTHTVVAPLIESSRAVFDSYRRPPPKDCNDPHTWSGCVEEHLVRALTLRALAARAPAAYRVLLRRNYVGAEKELDAASLLSPGDPEIAIAPRPTRPCAWRACAS